MQGWQLDRVTSPAKARALLAENGYEVGLARVCQLGERQREELEDVLCDNRAPVWIVLTSAEDLDNQEFCRLIYENCYDFYTLPLDDKCNYLRATLGHAYGISRLKDIGERQLSSLDECQMVGASPAILQVFQQIRKVAAVEAPVLINGESGTGKELIARAIHQRSTRKRGPFVAVNCGALPDTLIQSELFGHEKGAFTGAMRRKLGRLEMAQGGTLFLDEIGDLPLEQQVNLLRFLQEGTIERLGGEGSVPLDVRVIAATHVNLEEAVAKGRFREDLYYRLNVLNMLVPPLRERIGDVELLARFFFQKFSLDHNAKAKGFSQPALMAISHYSWPGNVREMINRIRRALVMSENRLISPEDLGLNGQGGDCKVVSLEEARNQAEREAVVLSLAQTQHNVSEAARLLGVSRVTLYRLLDKHKLN
ncbi:two component sigma-54 specific, Fis family transcriptional regulator [Gallaecimonas xiamenensis 3-C-1]|uniref:Two component sigma-54 specific, Fis family transcriptional regulator n=1 Tax=Gallaecimonas xiamenensis 3-C-1 TaxID=745411 RepID=K2JZX8_9GAMM|nr:two component sigma-54 specific, Fis family transcriptional regulator [Gallaecimonas xiamenensis 3-C-1]